MNRILGRSLLAVLVALLVWAPSASAQMPSGAEPGPRSAQPRNASIAAVTAACTALPSPRAMSASFHDQSSGERSSNVRGDATRVPPIR